MTQMASKCIYVYHFDNLDQREKTVNKSYFTHPSVLYKNYTINISIDLSLPAAYLSFGLKWYVAISFVAAKISTSQT